MFSAFPSPLLPLPGKAMEKVSEAHGDNIGSYGWVMEPEEQKASPGRWRHLATRLPECLALQLPSEEWTTSIPFKHQLTCHPANVSQVPTMCQVPDEVRDIYR